MRFIFSCGGTAGHVNPALAIAGRLSELEPDSEFLFVGALGKMEMELVPRAGYKIEGLKISNISRDYSLSGLAHNLDAIKNVATSLHEARRIIRSFKPDAVIGTGGYVCYPVLVAASEQHIPTFVHESNAVPGLTTKLLSERVDRIMVGFEESRSQYRHPERIIVTGTPVRREFDNYTKNAVKEELGIPVDMPLVISLWGSLGASYMNKIMLELIPMLDGKQGFHLIHSAGTMYYRGMKEQLKDTAPELDRRKVELCEYIYDMPRLMTAADLVMCRAGASTIAELCYMGKPVIMIPSPNVTNNHQEKNARVLEKAGGAKLMLEGEFTAEDILAEIKALISRPDKLASMSKAMDTLAVLDSNDKICSLILKLAKA